MTGREGETFPGFFMAEEGSRIRTNERSARRRRKAVAWECPHWEFAAIYGAGRGSCQGGSAGGFVALYQETCGKTGRWMHCEGPIPALPVAGLFLGGQYVA